MKTPFRLPILFTLFCSSSLLAQVVNGDFSAGKSRGSESTRLSSRLSRFILFALLLSAVCVMSPPAFAVTYDAAADFSVTNGNPNGVWTYGWSTTLTSTLNLYANGFVASNGNQVWDDPNHISLGAPDAANNPSNNQQGLLPAHTAAFHPGQSDEFSHFVWTAPTDGAFSISATFTPIDSGGTDVHILHNNVSLFTAEVTPGNPQSFSGVVTLLAGDKIDFAVGFGVDGSFFNDSTGLSATIYPGTCTPPPPNLVSWWPGDGNANDIQDSSNGLLKNGASFGSGKVGLAFSLDGEDDFVEVPDNFNIDLPGPITIDAWINPTTVTGLKQAIVNKADTSTNQAAYQFEILDGGSLQFIVSGSGSISQIRGVTTTNNVITAGVFTHVAATFNPSTQAMKIYVNGAEVPTTLFPGSTTVSAIFDSNQPIRIGAGLNDMGQFHHFFGGLIDEVELYSRDLSATEIANIFGIGSAGKCKPTCIAAPSGLVSWWPADGDAFDVQDGNSGTLQGGMTFTAGKVGQAFNFNGTDADVKVSASANLDVGAGNGMTIDLWINPANLNERSLVEWNSGQGTGIAGTIGVHFSSSVVSQGGSPGNLYANLLDTNGNSHFLQSAGGLVTTNTFQHVALTYDKSTGMATIYLNGAAVAGPTNLGIFTPQTSYDLYFGYRPAGAGSGVRYAGLMDEIEIFSRALSASEIQSIFNAGSAGKCKSIAAEGQFINISTRVSVGTETNVGIAGFILRSDTSPAPSKQVVVRGIGPSLTSRGVAGALQDPTIELRDSNGGLIASNDNWMDAANASALQATGLAPTDPKEAAILTTLSSTTTPGFTNYTAILAGKNNTTGVGLVEVYDLDSTSTTHLVNISTRAPVLTGDNVLIGGVIVRGGTAEEIVFRAIGPELGSRGVSNFLADPTLELHDGQGNLLDSNDNWMDSPEKDNIMASGLAPTDDRESAILATLFPGNYTAIVSGVGNTTGVGLVEAYRIGPPASP